jgi:hypothetical protein
MELDAKYVDVVVQRWQQLTGKDAKLDGDGRRFEEIARERGKEPVNIKLPPGDRGHRGADPRWAFGRAWIVPGAFCPNGNRK